MKTAKLNEPDSVPEEQHPEYLIRYEVHEFANKVSLWINKYPVMKVAPCGYWVALDQGAWNMFRDYDLYCSKSWTKKKWVSKNAGVRYAYPTKAEALNHLRHRQLKYERILTHRLERCKTALKVVKEQMQDPEKEISMEMELYEIQGFRSFTNEVY